MTERSLLEDLPEASRTALASASVKRETWPAALALDGRIGRMVLGASEPLLAQMRIAWWRDQLGSPREVRPQGDVLLDSIGETWAGREDALLSLVNGWEGLLGARPLTEEAVQGFVDGRADMAEGLAESIGQTANLDQARRAAKIWAYADLAVHGQTDEERSFALEKGRGLLGEPLRLPRSLRPLVVLAGLGKRSLKSGGQPLLGDRLSPLAALRLGIIGR